MVELSSFCTDSRTVKEGDIFVAIPCDNVIQHISEALNKGAQLVFTQEYCNWINNNRIVLVNDARLLASELSSFYYAKQPKINIAITGTNGKSSVAHFVSQIWSLCNIQSANLGTLGLFVNHKKTNPENIIVPNLTTPDPANLHKILNYLANNNIDNFVFEASSAALDQKRLHSVILETAAFTNLASDHLDYHKSHEEYLKSKLLLFNTILKQNKKAVVFGDDNYLYNQVKDVHCNIITFGLNKNNNIRAENIISSITNIKFDLIVNNERFNSIELNLTGEFQLLNVLCAIALVYTTGTDISKVIRIIDKLEPLCGRMERIPCNNCGNIFIDYAHTSEGFKTALNTLKKYCKGKLICVFGCGGNRDTTKRQEFGSIANDIVDIPIITDDNPRNEDPSLIRNEIKRTCPKAIEIADREEAIKKALSTMEKDDIVAIIGKGHETEQVYANNVKYFNDREVILKYLQ
ncbi:MAG: UDP-N-acetylmuramoyl-L-alanyl-D-glutamate--2,6-diaminopimelate ligase [Alphaproteobacteria bacterium]|nr:UDP-N-acetylmuramoyl-L-alanyl-D-glutamate--2,6-diaminopimelate ligase [Alphaproteobacteria bacterium]